MISTAPQLLCFAYYGPNVSSTRLVCKRRWNSGAGGDGLAPSASPPGTLLPIWLRWGEDGRLAALGNAFDWP